MPPSSSRAPASRAVALLLEFLSPGSGHLHVGANRAGGLLLGARVLATVVGLLALIPATRAMGFAGLVLVGFGPSVAVWVGALVRLWRLPVASFGAGGAGRALGVLALGAAVSIASSTAGRTLVQAFNIPAGSMVPSLEVGDRIFADMTARRPQVGDIVVFEFPENREQMFVKRVAALAGSTIEDSPDGLVVDGKPVPRCRVGVLGADETTLWLEKLGGLHLVTGDGKGPTARSWTVRAGELFVLGDNRDSSHDSRAWFDGRGGGVPESHVRGTARVVWWGRRGAESVRSLDRPILPGGAAHLAPALDRCVEELSRKP